MGVFATDENQVNYIYSSRSDLGKKVLGYVESLETECRTIDIVKDPLSDTVWAEVASLVGKPFDKLFSTDDVEGDSIDDNADFDTEGWLKLIKGNPELLQKPIVIKGEEARQIRSRSELLSYFGVDSAGLEKTMSDEAPTTSSNTEDETFVPKGE